MRTFVRNHRTLVIAAIVIAVLLLSATLPIQLIKWSGVYGQSPDIANPPGGPIKVYLPLILDTDNLSTPAVIEFPTPTPEPDLDDHQHP